MYRFYTIDKSLNSRNHRPVASVSGPEGYMTCVRVLAFTTRQHYLPASTLSPNVIIYYQPDPTRKAIRITTIVIVLCFDSPLLITWHLSVNWKRRFLLPQTTHWFCNSAISLKTWIVRTLTVYEAKVSIETRKCSGKLSSVEDGRLARMRGDSLSGRFSRRCREEKVSAVVRPRRLAAAMVGTWRRSNSTWASSIASPGRRIAFLDELLGLRQSSRVVNTNANH